MRFEGSAPGKRPGRLGGIAAAGIAAFAAASRAARETADAFAEGSMPGRNAVGGGVCLRDDLDADQLLQPSLELACRDDVSYKDLAS